MIDYDPRNWLRIIFQVRGSVLPRLFPRVLIAAAIGAGSAYLHSKTGFKFPSIAHTLIGVALGLLLVFRTNASYDRYWEGRRIMGQIINRTRDLTRQVATFLDGADEAAVAQRAALRRHITILYALLRQGLRAERDLSRLGIELLPGEVADLEPAQGRPGIAAVWISAGLREAIRNGRLTESRLWLMDANVTAIVDAWGGAQRIQNTPIPFAYAQHIKVFVVLFGFTVPFAMVDALGWYTPIASALLAFALFGIDEIGVEIEEPFGCDANDLPLERYGETIDRNTREMLEVAERMAKRT